MELPAVLSCLCIAVAATALVREQAAILSLAQPLCFAMQLADHIAVLYASLQLCCWVLQGHSIRALQQAAQVFLCGVRQQPAALQASRPQGKQGSLTVLVRLHHKVSDEHCQEPQTDS
jgi:hypothetical protein